MVTHGAVDGLEDLGLPAARWSPAGSVLLTRPCGSKDSEPPQCRPTARVSRYRCRVTAVAALLTDKYELTMLSAALRDGTAGRRTTFEVFARRLPDGPPVRRGGGHRPVPGALTRVRLRRRRAATSLSSFLDRCHAGLPARLPVRRRHRRLRRGRAVLPRARRCCRSPAPSPNACVLETLALSIFNHDTAIASAAARMVSAAARPAADRDGVAAHPRAGRGRRRAGRLHRRLRRHVQPRGAAPLRRPGAGHQRARLHDAAHHGRQRPTSEQAAFRAQVDALGVGTTLLVDTYDVTAGVANADRRRRHRAWARCASTPATSACWPGRCAPSSTTLGATGTADRGVR